MRVYERERERREGRGGPYQQISVVKVFGYFAFGLLILPRRVKAFFVLRAKVIVPEREREREIAEEGGGDAVEGR
jgi:hypothetical protein